VREEVNEERKEKEKEREEEWEGEEYRLGKVNGVSPRTSRMTLLGLLVLTGAYVKHTIR